MTIANRGTASEDDTRTGGLEASSGRHLGLQTGDSMKPSPSNTDFGEIHDHRAGETPKFDRSHRSMSISLAVLAVDEMHTMQFGVCDVWVAHRLRAIVDRAVWNSGGGLPNTALHRANALQVRRASGTRRKSCAACQSWKRVAHLRARGLHPEHVWAEGGHH